MTSSGPAWTRERKKANVAVAASSGATGAARNGGGPPFYTSNASHHASSSSSSLPETQDAPYLAHAVRHHGQYTLVPPDNSGRRRAPGQVVAGGSSSLSSAAAPLSTSVVEPARAMMGSDEPPSTTAPEAAVIKKKKKKPKNKKPVVPSGPPDPAILDAVFNAGRNGNSPSSPSVAGRPGSTHSRERGEATSSSRSMARSGSAGSSSMGTGPTTPNQSGLRGPRAIPHATTTTTTTTTTSSSQDPATSTTVNEYPFPHPNVAPTSPPSLQPPTRAPASASAQTSRARVRAQSPSRAPTTTIATPVAQNASPPRQPASRQSTLFDTPIMDPNASTAPPAFESPPPAYMPAPESRAPSPLNLPAQQQHPQEQHSVESPVSSEDTPTTPQLVLPEIGPPEPIEPSTDDPLVIAWEADRAAGLELELRIQRDLRRRKAAAAARAERRRTLESQPAPTNVARTALTPQADSAERSTSTTAAPLRPTSPFLAEPTTSAVPPSSPTPTPDIPEPSEADRRELAAAEAEDDVPRIARALSVYANRRFAAAAERRIAQSRRVRRSVRESVTEEQEGLEEPVRRGSAAPVVVSAPPRSPSPVVSAPVASTSAAPAPVPSPAPSAAFVSPPKPTTVENTESSESEEEEDEAEEDVPARLARAVTLNARRRFAEAAERRVAMERAAKDRQQRAAEQSMPTVQEAETSPVQAATRSSEPPHLSSTYAMLFPPRPRLGDPLLGPPARITSSPSPSASPSYLPSSIPLPFSSTTPVPGTTSEDHVMLAEPPAPPLPRRPIDATLGIPPPRPATLDELLDTPLSASPGSPIGASQRISLRRAPPVPRSRPGSMQRRYPVPASSSSDPVYPSSMPPPPGDVNPSLLSTIPSAERRSLPSPLEPTIGPSPPRPRRPAPLPPPPRGTTSYITLPPLPAVEESPRPSRRPLPVPPGPTGRVDAFSVMRMREQALATLENREPRTADELMEIDRAAIEALQNVSTLGGPAVSAASTGGESASRANGAAGTSAQAPTLGQQSNSTINHDLTAYTELDLLLARLENEANGSHYEDLTTLGEVMGPATEVGASQSELESLDVARVELERRRIDKHGKVKQKLSVVGVRCVDCTICLARFKVGELAVVLPECLHAFHETCIVRWLARSRTCALCRANIFPPRPVIEF